MGQKTLTELGRRVLAALSWTQSLIAFCGPFQLLTSCWVSSHFFIMGEAWKSLLLTQCCATLSWTSVPGMVMLRQSGFCVSFKFLPKDLLTLMHKNLAVHFLPGKCSCSYVIFHLRLVFWMWCQDRIFFEQQRYNVCVEGGVLGLFVSLSALPYFPGYWHFYDSGWGDQKNTQWWIRVLPVQPRPTITSERPRHVAFDGATPRILQ